MEDLRFAPPCPAHRALLLEYKREFEQAGESIDGSAGLGLYRAFDQWLRCVQDNARPETLRPGSVLTSVYLVFDGELFVGMVDIRHRLDSGPSVTFGHIGYSVRPALRRRGYATRILRKALEECKALGLSQVVLVCRQENAASARVMQRCGARLQCCQRLGQIVLCRYCVQL